MWIERAIERVRAFRKAKGWSRTRYARLAGLGPNALAEIDERDWAPRADTLRKLEAVIPPEFRPVAPQPTAEERV